MANRITGVEELICNKSLDGYLTFGVVYEVIDETPQRYVIIDDTGTEHSFTKSPDEEGKSYQTWLNVLQED